MANHTKIHGMSHLPIYGLWNAMKNRCYRKNTKAYSYYGGRGITVCERWLKFENFFADMGHRPVGKSLERRDNNKGYSPENCYWATAKEQALNTRNKIRITFKGETLTLSQWADKLGLPRDTLYQRNRRKMPVERLLSTENLSGNRYTRNW